MCGQSKDKRWGALFWCIFILTSDTSCLKNCPQRFLYVSFFLPICGKKCWHQMFDVNLVLGLVQAPWPAPWVEDGKMILFWGRGYKVRYWGKKKTHKGNTDPREINYQGLIVEKLLKMSIYRKRSIELSLRQPEFDLLVRNFLICFYCGVNLKNPQMFLVTN